MNLLEKYIVSPEDDGSYLLGENQEFTLEEKGLLHIFKGELTERLHRDSITKVRSKELIIKGGLHTYNAWINFKKKRGDIVHFRTYDPSIHKLWYYARSLQNGTILLKIPHKAFQSKNAKLTKYADIYYKSGYLWKTLFPKTMSINEIIASINEALHKVDIEESQNNIIIGYSMTSDPFKAIKIRIQLVDNKIISSFPTWGQPMTGNDGKPYSHADTIALKIAESTEFFDDDNSPTLTPKSLFPTSIPPETLNKITPAVILNRPNFNTKNDRESEKEIRNNFLLKYSAKLNHDEIEYLIKYLKDWNLSKDTFLFVSAIYDSSYKDFNRHRKIKNGFKLYQNIHDVIHILAECDKIHKTNNSLEYIQYYLSKKVIHAGFLDFWESKRIMNLFIDISLKSDNENSIELLLNTLYKSPLRAGLFTEFNLNPFLNHDDSIIGLTDIKIPLNENHFYTYCAQNLGENYILIMDEKKRINFVKKIINSTGKHNKHLIRDTIQHSTGSDFEPFSTKFDKIVDLIVSGEKSSPAAKSLQRIMYDYSRFQISQVYRITIEKRGLLSEEIDYSKMGTKSVHNHIKSKHERDFVSVLTNIFFDSIIRLFEFMDEKSILEEAILMKENFSKQKIPMPKKIPSYIDNWSNGKSARDIAKKYNQKMY